MSQKEKMKKNLLDDINSYISQLVYLKDVFAVYNHIDELKHKMQSSPNFTLVTEAALVDSFMMTLARLYDKSEKAKTIPNLIEKCKKNINLFLNVQNTMARFENFEDRLLNDEYIPSAVDVILHRRDNIFAHNDQKYFGTKIINDNSYLPSYKIKFLISFTEEVLDFLFSELSEDTRVQTKYDKDLENLLV